MRWTKRDTSYGFGFIGKEKMYLENKNKSELSGIFNKIKLAIQWWHQIYYFYNLLFQMLSKRSRDSLSLLVLLSSRITML